MATPKATTGARRGGPEGEEDEKRAMEGITDPFSHLVEAALGAGGARPNESYYLQSRQFASSKGAIMGQAGAVRQSYDNDGEGLGDGEDADPQTSQPLEQSGGGAAVIAAAGKKKRASTGKRKAKEEGKQPTQRKEKGARSKRSGKRDGAASPLSLSSSAGGGGEAPAAPAAGGDSGNTALSAVPFNKGILLPSLQDVLAAPPSPPSDKQSVRQRLRQEGRYVGEGVPPPTVPAAVPPVQQPIENPAPQIMATRGRHVSRVQQPPMPQHLPLPAIQGVPQMMDRRYAPQPMAVSNAAPLIPFAVLPPSPAQERPMTMLAPSGMPYVVPGNEGGVPVGDSGGGDAAEGNSLLLMGQPLYLDRYPFILVGPKTVTFTLQLPAVLANRPVSLKITTTTLKSHSEEKDREREKRLLMKEGAAGPDTNGSKAASATNLTTTTATPITTTTVRKRAKTSKPEPAPKPLAIARKINPYSSSSTSPTGAAASSAANNNLRWDRQGANLTITMTAVSSKMDIFCYHFWVTEDEGEGPPPPHAWVVDSHPAVVYTHTTSQLMPALKSLICYQYAKMDAVPKEDMLSSFQLLQDDEYVPSAFHSFPIPGDAPQCHGRDVPFVIDWFMAAYEIFKQCKSVYEKGFMHGFVSRQASEAALRTQRIGTVMIRLGSRGLVISIAGDAQQISHVEIVPPSPKEIATVLACAACACVLRSDNQLVDKKEVMGHLEQKGSRGYITLFELDYVMNRHDGKEESKENDMDGASSEGENDVDMEGKEKEKGKEAEEDEGGKPNRKRQRVVSEEQPAVVAASSLLDDTGAE